MPRALRSLADQAFSRAAGAPLIAGNQLRLLRDAVENYDAWLEAIAAARETIFFENYIFSPDRTGTRFRDALAERASAGVKVRLLVDGMGTSLRANDKFWRPLTDAGGEVRVYRPVSWLRLRGLWGRDHRKTVTVDGRSGFISGVCVDDRWLGDAGRGIPPWRDTGVAVSGPAVAQMGEAFAAVWGECGRALDPAELVPAGLIGHEGEVEVRVIATSPSRTGLYRLDMLVAALARKRLWLTDAYFVGLPAYVAALRAAAADGVDVRLLVPGASDIPVLKPLSVAGYRPLLESGVRVFEWRGSMLHAKTAVADGRWARVGSSNLNIASWMGNCELDLAADDEPFAQEMERAYEADLANSTEIVLAPRKPLRFRKRGRGNRVEGHIVTPGERVKKAVSGIVRLGNEVGAAFVQQRRLGPGVRVRWLALVLLALAAVAFWIPQVVAWPLGFLALWLAVAVWLRPRR